MKKSIISLIIIASLSLTACGNNVVSISRGEVSKQQKQPINATQVKSLTTQPVTSTNLQYYFTRANGRPDLQLINTINSANKTLNIAIYSLTKPNIVNSIIADKNRGIDVRIITDKIESQSKSEAKELVLLKNDGIPIKINSHSGLMHMKVSIIDNSEVTTGSYNYSSAATTINDEVFVIIKDRKVATDFNNEFNIMWNDNVNYRNY